PRRDFAVTEPAVALFRVAHPGAEVDFVHGDGRVPGVPLVAQAHPFVVAPLVVEVPDDGAGARRGLAMIAVGIGLVDAVHVETRTDVVLVNRTFAKAAHEALPDTGVFARSHG